MFKYKLLKLYNVHNYRRLETKFELKLVCFWENIKFYSILTIIEQLAMI